MLWGTSYRNFNAVLSRRAKKIAAKAAISMQFECAGHSVTALAPPGLSC
jgi:hypothetical protein